jgi:hypothetical protein
MAILGHVSTRPSVATLASAVSRPAKRRRGSRHPGTGSRRSRGGDLKARAAQIALAEGVRIGVDRSLRSRRSVASVASYRSVGSVASAWSIGSVFSAASALSAGSLGSLASTGSILSVASSGSILSIGSSGGVLSLGGRRRGARDTGGTGGAGPPVDAVRQISGLLALTAVVAAPWSRHAA